MLLRRLRRCPLWDDVQDELADYLIHAELRFSVIEGRG